MKNKRIKAVMIAIAIVMGASVLSLAQEIDVNGGRVKIKTGTTEITTKGENASIKNKSGHKSKSSTSVVKSITKDKTITGSNINQTVICNGETLSIIGSDNKITIKGYVSAISISGSDNRISIDKVKMIKVIGSDNTVSYTTTPNTSGRADVRTTGNDNTVTKVK